VRSEVGLRPSDEKNRTIARKAPGQILRGKCSGQFRVIHGGGWFDDAASVRATRRYIVAVGPTDRTPDIGFRLAMILP